MSLRHGSPLKEPFQGVRQIVSVALPEDGVHNKCVH